ncbi:MAG: hypothetical protein A2W28_11690 [Gammaproteobacteria bacterium RBG_16_51_14]|nr:MAG: hypothetical protein A2W28_11690 [Gammaproteobacteria bacterium RBG_16_51_14]
MLLLKHIHVTCVVLTFISFSVRGLWMLRDSPYLQHHLARTVPHVIDTVLLLSGLTQAVIIYRNLLLQPWLLAKIAALTIYIILGSVALKYGQTKVIRLASLFGAWLVFFYIIAVAITRTPLPTLPSI